MWIVSASRMVMARYDCTGVCNGTVKTGDLNNDTNQNVSDAQEYVMAILGNDIHFRSM